MIYITRTKRSIILYVGYTFLFQMIYILVSQKFMPDFVGCTFLL